MRRSCVAAIIRKDAVMAYRNKLLLLAFFGGILFSLIYYALPAQVEDTMVLGVYDEGDSSLVASLPPFFSKGVEFDDVSSLDALEGGINGGEYIAGIVVPAGFDVDAAAGAMPTLEVLFKSDADNAVKTTIAYLVETLSDYQINGSLPVPLSTDVIGTDTSGMQVPLREQSVPFYLIMALMMEMWTIATLIIEETSAGTMRAVLVTPARPSDVISAKTIMGGAYTLGVVIIILLLTGSLRGDIIALGVGVVLGALLAVSLGLLLGSLTKTITGSYIYVSVPMLVLILPALVLLVPGISHDVIRLIPTYYLVDAFDAVLNHGAALADVWKQYLVIFVLGVAFFSAGVLALRRRYE